MRALAAVLVWLAVAMAAANSEKASPIDPAFPSANGSVLAVAVHENRIYLAGDFTEVDGVPRQRLAALYEDTGQLDLAWDPRADATVASLAVVGDRLYAGGAFRTVNKRTDRRGLAAFELAGDDREGAADEAWDPGLDSGVSALATDGQRLFVSGSFRYANGAEGSVERQRFAAYNLADGSATAVADPAWTASFDDYAWAMDVRDGYLYVGGRFGMVDDQPREKLAAFNLATGKLDERWRPSADGHVLALRATDAGLYAGGAFSHVDGAERPYLAALEPAAAESPGALRGDWKPELLGPVASIVAWDDGLAAGGAFTGVKSADGVGFRPYLALFPEAIPGAAADARADFLAPFQLRAGSRVAALAATQRGLVAAGSFDSNGDTFTNLARFPKR